MLLIVQISYGTKSRPRFLLAELKHVESESVVIIGKGVGGYLATMMMAKDTIHLLEETREIFKCGIIVSPTIDWFKYGSRILK